MSTNCHRDTQHHRWYNQSSGIFSYLDKTNHRGRDKEWQIKMEIEIGIETKIDMGIKIEIFKQRRI